MTSPAFEVVLARIYTDEKFRRQFLADPEGTASGLGLTAEELRALVRIDRVGVEMAARTFMWKRERLRKPLSSIADILWRRLKRFKSHEYKA